MFGLLAKVVGNYPVDQGLIPGSLQLRQNSAIGQEIGNFWLFLTWYFNPILKQADKMAIVIRFGVLTKAI